MKFQVTKTAIKNAVITIEGEKLNEADPMNLERQRIEDPEVLIYQFDLKNKYAHKYIYSWLNRQKTVADNKPSTYAEAIQRVVGIVTQSPRMQYRVGF